MRFLFYIFFIALFGNLQAENVSISGNAGTFYHGQNIYLMQVDEALLGSKTLLAKTQVDLTGSFSFSVENNSIKSVEILSAFISFPFKIEANANYKIELKNPGENEYVTVASNTIKDVLFYGLKPSDVNAEVIIFNTTLDSLIDAELANFNASRYSKSLKNLYTIYSYKPAYIKEYAQSAIAMQILNFSSDKKAFFKNYIDGKNFNLDNAESVNLLNKFYGNALDNLLRFENAENKKKINNANPKAFYALFESWDFCNTPTLLNFAAISNAYSIFINGDYTKDEFLNLLDFIETKNLSQKLKQITQAIKTDLGINFEPVLQDLIAGIEVDYSKKALVLCFYSSISDIAIRELNELKTIASKSNMPLQIVKICSDCGSNSAGISNSDINIEKDPIVFDSLRLYSLPKFSLMSTEKTLIKEWLEPPSHGAEKQIMTILTRRDRP